MSISQVYIVKAIPEELHEGFDGRIVGEHTDGTNKWANTNITDDQDVDLSDFRKKPPNSGHAMQTGRQASIDTCDRSVNL